MADSRSIPRSTTPQSYSSGDDGSTGNSHDHELLSFCDICQKGFKRLQEKKRHLGQVHSPSTPCPHLSGRTHKSGYNMRKHIAKEHSNIGQAAAALTPTGPVPIVPSHSTEYVASNLPNQTSVLRASHRTSNLEGHEVGGVIENYNANTILSPPNSTAMDLDGPSCSTETIATLQGHPTSSTSENGLHPSHWSQPHHFTTSPGNHSSIQLEFQSAAAYSYPCPSGHNNIHNLAGNNVNDHQEGSPTTFSHWNGTQYDNLPFYESAKDVPSNDYARDG